MLKSPTPYPEAGSYALHRPPNFDSRLIRIQRREQIGRDGYALITFVGRDGASGNKTIPLSELVDGTPLTAEELTELARLEKQVGSASARPARRMKRADLQRLEHLKNRRSDARILRDHLLAAGLAEADALDAAA